MGESHQLRNPQVYKVSQPKTDLASSRPWQETKHRSICLLVLFNSKLFLKIKPNQENMLKKPQNLRAVAHELNKITLCELSKITYFSRTSEWSHHTQQLQTAKPLARPPVCSSFNSCFNIRVICNP